MKYQKKKFTLDPQSDAYRDNWDAVFADEEDTDKDKCLHLTCDYEIGGRWSCEYPSLFVAKEKAETPVKESRPECGRCGTCYTCWVGAFTS